MGAKRFYENCITTFGIQTRPARLQIMTFPRRTRAENAAFVVESIKALGLQVPGGSRLMQMYSTLASQKVILPADQEFETAVEAERDMQVLAFVLDVAAVRGLVFHDQQVRRLDLNGNWCLEGMNLEFPLADLDESQQRDFRCFTESYFSGLSNRE